MTNGAISLIQHFQETGEGFSALWDEIRSTIDVMVRRRLRKHLVAGGRFGLDDDQAVADATQDVVFKLLQLPNKPDSWFIPRENGVDGLSAWLSRFASNAVADFSRQFHGARKGRKVIAESGLPMNELSEARSLVKTIPAKIDVEDTELRSIMNEALDAIPEESRTLIRMHIWEELSERTIARKIGRSVTAVHHRLVKARNLLASELAKRGVRADWLTAA